MTIEVDFADADELGGGDYLSEPGSYHCAVTTVYEGESAGGKLIDGFAFESEVLAGTSDGCTGKKHTETIFAPNLQHSEAGQRAAKARMTAFLIAVGLIDPSQMGSTGTVDLNDAVGRQFFVRLKAGQDPKYLQVDYAAFWHVDDPDASKLPKNEGALKLVPVELRHDKDWFGWKKKKRNAPAKKTADALADL